VIMKWPEGCEQFLYEAAKNIYFVSTQPSVILKPRLFMDGDQWCALYGDSIQEGVAGFGKSPRLAMEAFDKAWYAGLPPKGVRS
jgi:hypothetical protein